MKARDWIVATSMFALGVVSWVLIAKVSGRREAWDSELYFSVFMPSIAIIVGLVSWLIPRQYGRWAFLPFLGQAVGAFVQNPTANLLPLGLIMFAILGALCLLPAVIGARLGKMRENRGATDPS